MKRKVRMPTNESQNNLMKYMANPRSFILKRWFHDILRENYGPHDEIIERVATSLATDKDMEDFGKLIGQVYQTAYMKAVNEYRDQAEKMGLTVTVGSEVQKSS